MKPSVYIEGDKPAVSQMFINEGWKITPSIMNATVVCFTGGPDVSPMLYEAQKHPQTSADPVRDALCWDVYMSALVNTVPMVGICRGAQFLNVINGGGMFQNVDGHKSDHLTVDVLTGEVYTVSSYHHQIMIPDKESSETILISNISTRREGSTRDVDKSTVSYPDVEACYYEDTNCLCFQPHPEYVTTEHESKNLFFLLMKQYLL